MKFAAVAKEVTTWSQTQSKFDLQNVSTNAKRLRNELDLSVNSIDDDDDEQVEDLLISHVNDICEKWMEAEARANSIEFQTSQKMDTELKKMEEMYLLALKRENEMMDCHINERRSKQEGHDRETEKEMLDKLHERQQMVLKEIDQLLQKLQGHDTKEKNLLDKIAELERENLKERQHSHSLRAELEKYSSSSQMIDEDGDEDDAIKENDDPLNRNSFDTFLDLRKQLRRSIFKKEEVNIYIFVSSCMLLISFH
jgi:kinesin family protein 20